ncbi:MAG: hypothetical protein ACEPOW_08265 [Bacteroidales bacterium]
MEKHEFEDQFLRKILDELPKEEAPKGFTNKVMGRIDEQEQSDFLTETGLPRLKVILYCLLGVVAMVSLLYFFDSSWFFPLEDSLQLDTKSTYNSISKFFELSSQLRHSFDFVFSKYGIVLGIVSIVILERILALRSKRQAYMF